MPELVVQHLDLFGAQPGDVEHRHQPGRRRSLQILVILQAAGGDEFGDFLLERVADALDFAQARLGDEPCPAVRSEVSMARAAFR